MSVDQAVASSTAGPTGALGAVADQARVSVSSAAGPTGVRGAGGDQVVVSSTVEFWAPGAEEPGAVGWVSEG
ncbi:hypothetical protein [Streptomyces sp. NBC_01518]|uniref:hypothetical protein n=1 Tax=Streptomyces sp. NBC_01518 TaxID=2903891 RepID=UPI003867082E